MVLLVDVGFSVNSILSYFRIFMCKISNLVNRNVASLIRIVVFMEHNI